MTMMTKRCARVLCTASCPRQCGGGLPRVLVAVMLGLLLVARGNIATAGVFTGLGAMLKDESRVHNMSFGAPSSWFQVGREYPAH